MVYPNLEAGQPTGEPTGIGQARPGEPVFALSDVLGILKMIEEMLMGYTNPEQGQPSAPPAYPTPEELARPTYGNEADILSRLGG